MACNGSGWVGKESCPGCRNCRGREGLPGDKPKEPTPKDQPRPSFNESLLEFSSQFN